MSKQDILNATETHIRKLFEEEGSGHDWWHIHRVRNTALKIARVEKADFFIVELAALLHDIADHKFHGGDETAGPREAENWLRSLNVEEEIIQKVSAIVAEISFKGAEVETPMSTIEGEVVQDADRLDALGAIGIARAFAYGGYKGRLLYHPDIKPVSHESFEAYKKSSGPTINHFYEKLFLLKDRMNTRTGAKLAEERHRFMQQFVDQFMEEWNASGDIIPPGKAPR